MRTGLLAMLIATLLYGCSFKSSALNRSTEKLTSNATALNEEARALTTGALDALQHAPTNPPTSLAKTFLQRDQQIVGLPVKRIDVEALLAGQTEALNSLTNRLSKLDSMLDDREKLRVENDGLRDQLVAMGRKWEEEHNRTILHRMFSYLGFTGSLLAIGALIVFFPPALVVIGRLIGFIVGKLPQLAGAFGVVSTKAFDGVVAGVEKFRLHNAEHIGALEDHLSGAMDQAHKDLVKARKAVIPSAS